MKLKKFVAYLIIAVILVQLAGLISPAPPAYAEDQVILKYIDIGYFDIWKHSNGVWQDTNGDTYPDYPDQVEIEYHASYHVPIELLQGYEITKVVGQQGISYEDYNDPLTVGGWAKNLKYSDLNDQYFRYTPNNYHIFVPQPTPLTPDFNPLPDQNGNGPLIDVMILAPKDKAKNIKESWQAANVEGWRWYLPFTITVYGHKKPNVTVQKVEVTDKNGTPVASVTRGSAPIVNSFPQKREVYNVKATLTTSDSPGSQLINADVRGTEAVLGGANPVEIGRGIIPVMNFPDQKEVTFQWTPISSNDKTLTVYYNNSENDPNGNLNADKTDDWLSIDFASKFDLVMDSIAVHDMNLDPGSWTTATINFHLEQSSIGPVPARVAFYVNDQRVSLDTYDPMYPDQTYTKTIRWQVPLRANDPQPCHYIDGDWVCENIPRALDNMVHLKATIWVNDASLVSKEIDLKNNTKTLDLSLAGTNLAVTSISAPSPVMVNSSFPIKVTVSSSASDRISTILVVRANGKEIVRTPITLAAFSEQEYTYTWIPNVTGSVILEAEVNPDRNVPETTYADNRKNTSVIVDTTPIIYPLCKNTSQDFTVVYKWWWYDPCCYVVCGKDDCWCVGCWKLAVVPVTYHEQFKIISATLSASWRSAQETTDFDIMHENAKTIAGFPMTLKVVTEYRTDWESKVPQSPCCPPASPFGNVYNGPTEMRVQWPDGKVTILDRTDQKVYHEGNWYVERSTWEFPLADTITDGWLRYVYSHENTKEGLYGARLSSNEAGRTGVCDSFDFGVEVTGTMYDLVKTHVVQ